MITKNIATIKFSKTLEPTGVFVQNFYDLKYCGSISIGELMLQFIEYHKKVSREKIIGHGYDCSGENSFEIEFENRIDIYLCTENKDLCQDNIQ